MKLYFRKAAAALVILLFAAPALACMSRGYLATDTCRVSFKHGTNISNLLFENKTKCGLTDKEISWLITNIDIYSKVTKETDEQYKARLAALEARKDKKTPENKAQWEIIDKKNACGDTSFERKGQFTFEYRETCLWDDERQTCNCANC